MSINLHIIMTISEIFEKNQILTFEKANQLISKKVMTTAPEYRCNHPRLNEFIICRIVSEWDFAKERKYTATREDHANFDNYQEYWASFFTKDDIERHKNDMLIIDENNNQRHVCSLRDEDTFFQVPTFYGSDADRPVYYIEC